MIRRLDDGDVDVVCEVLGVARLRQGDGHYLVHWDGDTPTGHLHLATTTPPELQDLEVRAPYRGRGIAKALIAAAEAECATSGCASVRVTVSVSNDVARELYRSLGYRDAGVPPRRVVGTIQVRTGPIEVDDTLLTLDKELAAP